MNYMPIPTANSSNALYDIVSDHEFGPDDFSIEMAERLIRLARERTQMRGEGPMDPAREKDYLFTSTWQRILKEKLGRHGDRLNEYALGTLNVVDGKDAYLVEDAIVPQWRWLDSGDGRMNDVEPVDLTDTDYHDKQREMWWPKDYALVVEFADDLLMETPTIGDAM